MFKKISTLILGALLIVTTSLVGGFIQEEKTYATSTCLLGSIFGCSDVTSKIDDICNGDNCIQKGVETVGNDTSIKDTLSKQKLSDFIQGIVKYLLTFISIIAVMYVIYAGFQVMTGAGDEEKLKKAKKIILYVFIGIAIMWLAYAIVNWFISKVVIEAKKTTMNSNNSIVSLFIPTAHAYTESDFNTFDYYKRELEKLKTQAGTEYYENKVISEGTLSTIQSIITQAIDTLPDNPDYEVKNTEIITQLQAIIRKTIKDSKSSSQAKEMITGIETFLKNVQVDRIKAEIQVNPENGNAPLTVTFNAIGASDPSGNDIPAENYIWWIRGQGSSRIELGRGPTLLYTFTENKSYKVFLDIVSAHRNEKGKVDVLPFSESKDIQVRPAIGNIQMLINGINVSKLSTLKIHPNIGKMGLIIDASASKAAGGMSITNTRWEFGNGEIVEYDGPPGVERQIFANEGRYQVKLTLSTNQEQKIEKILYIEIHDPSAIIQTSKVKGFIGEDFSFNALSYLGGGSNVTYQWLVSDAEGTKKLGSGNGNIFSYKFDSVGTYLVNLKTVNANGKTDTDTKEIVIESREPVVGFVYQPVSPQKPNTIRLDATQSYDQDSSTSELIYEWKIDNKKVDLFDVEKNGAIGHFTFVESGKHTIEVTAINKYNKIKTASQVVQIDSLLSIENFIADPQVSQRKSDAGARVDFSIDAPNAQFFEWDFGDGTPRLIGGESQVYHMFNRSGKYTVNVTIKDASEGKSNTVSKTVYITESDTPYAVMDVKIDSKIVLPTKDSICEGMEATDDMYIISRIGTTNIDGTKSINIDGTNSSLVYTWQYMGQLSVEPVFSRKFDEIGCSPITLSVKGSNGAMHSSRSFLKVINTPPKLGNLTITEDSTNKNTSSKAIVNVSVNNSRDEDGVITSYLWYYYTESDKEPQDFRSTQSSKTTFVLPNINEKYYFGVIIEDNDGATIDSRDILKENSPTYITNNGNINIPLITVTTTNNNINAGEEVTFDVLVKNIAGKNLTDKSEFQWDFDGDGVTDLKTTNSRVTRKFENPGKFNCKVKATYNGSSNTKYQSIQVKNDITPKITGYKIGDNLFFFNTTEGIYKTAQWRIGNYTSDNPYNITVSSTDLSEEIGTLDVSDGTTSKTLTFNTNELQQYTPDSSSDLSFLTIPAIEGNVIHLSKNSQKVFIYPGSAGKKATNYAIDIDIENDSDLNGTPNDDEDNKNTDSYRNGDVFVITPVPQGRKNEQTLRVSFINNATTLATKDIKIIFDYIPKITDTTNSGSTTSSGVISLESIISKYDRENLVKFEEIVRTLPQDDRAYLMKSKNLLIDNWSDSQEKTRILLDAQDHINNIDTGKEIKDSLSNIITAFLMSENQAADDITVAISVIKGLIPQTHPSYTSISQKLEEIANHPNNYSENKKLGSEILSLIKDDTSLTTKDKNNIKSQLIIITAGGSQSVSEEETKTVQESTSLSGIAGFIVGAMKLFFFLIVLIIFAAIGGFILFKVSNKDETLGFQDWIIEKLSGKHNEPKSPSVSISESKPIVINNIPPIVPTVVQPLQEDLLSIHTPPAQQEANNIIEDNPQIASTVPDITTDITGSDGKIPDWLKSGNKEGEIGNTDILESSEILLSQEIKANTIEEIEEAFPTPEPIIESVENIQTEEVVDTTPINIEPQIIEFNPLIGDEKSLPEEQNIVNDSKSEIDEIPDWLKDITYTQEDKKETVKSEKNTTVLEKSPHLEEIPDWLKESVQSEEKSDITETVSEGLEVPVPQETISQEKQNTTPSKSGEKKIVQNDEEIPDWLK